jgi:hypothetical protein
LSAIGIPSICIRPNVERICYPILPDYAVKPACVGA